jgi:hypothetical protein
MSCSNQHVKRKMYGGAWRRGRRALARVAASVRPRASEVQILCIHSIALSSVRPSSHILRWRGGCSVVNFSQSAPPPQALPAKDGSTEEKQRSPAMESDVAASAAVSSHYEQEKLNQGESPCHGTQLNLEA